ncbi:MAG: SusC/RagA family TonB-linked outer membrane protein [Flavobacteriaceae bacterium]|nr:MAG: SusC/RagA family TonB-linked outer membrane protein [Flavobacteriaceae bacterium]
MNYKLKKMFFIAMMFASSVIFAQQTVTGTVLDADGPLPGANVLVKGSNNGTMTDFDGKFTLNNVSSDAILVITYIGYLRKETQVNGQFTINVTLLEDVNALDEVVIVGYGKQSRAVVTGAVSQINADQISELPVSRADQALQGRASGVTVINNGSPGSPPVIRIRGLGTVNSNQPLTVIDGVVGANLGDLNANDIESISILKDASTAAIYGALGANGVIVVTTKKGKGGALKLNFNTWVGVQSQNKRYDLLNTDEYVQYAREFGQLQDPVAVPVRITDPQYASYLNTNTDWQDEIFQTGFQQNYNISASGGNENSNYLMSLGYLEQDGIIKATDYSRVNFRANSDFTYGKFKLGESFSVSFNDNVGYPTGGRSQLEHAIKMAPYFEVYNASNLGGYQGPTSGLDNQDAENPVRGLEFGNRNFGSENLLGNLYASYELIEGLTLKTQGGINYTNSLYEQFIPSYIDNENDGGGQHQQLFASITKNTTKFESYSWTNSLDYVKTFNESHNLNVLLVGEVQNNTYKEVRASSTNDVSDEINQLTLNNASLTSRSTEYTRQGYLARVNYDYDNKYIFAASIRADASSRFGKDSRWGTFPSVALGWNVAKEEFLINSSISNLKLRGSWGVTGNDAIGDYRYSSSLTSNYNYPFGANEALGVGTTATGPADSTLKWEETSMTNIGVDLGFLNNSLNFAFEYYKNKSDDLLMNEPLPPSMIIHNNSVTRNIGSVETSGFEMVIGYNDYEGDFTWGVNFNMGTSKNEVLNLGATEAIFGGGFENQNITRTIVGEPMFHFYGYETDGIFQTQGEIDSYATQNNVAPGDIRFKDTNEDGVIDADDRTIIGNPFPDFTFGLSTNAKYKNFDFSMFWSGMTGNEIYNTNIYDLEGMTRLFNSGTAVLNRWTGEGTSNTVPRAFGAPSNVNVSDRFVEDGSFARLKNLSIGYKIPLSSDVVSKLRIYISGQNLITISDYSGLDAEIGFFNPNNQNNGSMGIDRGNYPTPKTYTVGLQMSF